jgi:protein-disulfide isomerase
MDSDKKTMIIFGIATVAIIGIGALLLSRNGASASKPTAPVNQDILVKPDSHKIQALNEKAVLVEFGDFVCPACGSYFPLVKKLSEDYKNNLTIVFRNFPLSQHKNALPAAYAAEAAGMQGKYWGMYDMLYENQAKWTDSDSAMTIFENYAKSLGLDFDKFKADAASDEVKKRVNNDYTDGVALGINATPTFYLNGIKMGYPRSYDDFKAQVEAAIQNNNGTTDTASSPTSTPAAE